MQPYSNALTITQNFIVMF